MPPASPAANAAIISVATASTMDSTPQDASQSAWKIFEQRHIDLAHQAQHLNTRAMQAASKVAWATALSGVAGTALPLIFHKKIANSWPLRILWAGAAGIGTAIIGGIGSAYLFLSRLNRERTNIEAQMKATFNQDKDDVRTAIGGVKDKAMDIKEKVSDRLHRQAEKTGGSHMEPHAQETSQSQPQIPLPEAPVSSYAASLEPRDPSRAAQATKEAAQAGAPSIPSP